MKILIGNKGKVDFEEPILLSEKQKEEFEKFFRETLGMHVSSPEKRLEIRSERLGDQKYPEVDWDLESDRLTVQPDLDDEDVAARIGKTPMSVVQRRRTNIMRCMIDRRKKGLRGFSLADILDFVENYHKEKRTEKEKRKAVLNICEECGLYHDPISYKEQTCEYDGYNLVRERVGKMKYELYSTQPEFDGDRNWLDNYFFKKYPALDG